MLPFGIVSHAPPPVHPVLIGRPCRAHNVLAGRFVRDPRSGRSLLVLTDMNETGGMELILIDPQTGKGRSYRAPAGSGSWALHAVPGARLVVGTFYDGRFMVFDLRSRRFIASVAFPGESYIWNLAIGKDGRVYGGTYPGGKLGALDLERMTVEDCGAPARPNMYLRNVSALPDGRILCSFGMEKPCTLIYDPAAKRFEEPPPALRGIATGVVWNEYFLAGAQVFGPRSLEAAHTVPFPVPEGASWTVDTNLTNRDTLWLRQGQRLFRYRSEAGALELFTTATVPGGRMLAASADGFVGGIRGQEYFILRKGDEEVAFRRIPAEPGPRPTLFLRCDGTGRVWGGPHFGQTLFYVDTRTRKTTNTLTVSDHGGEVYDVAFAGRVAFAASYSGGEIIRYDPEAEWRPGADGNPRTIAGLGSRGYIRPTGGIVLGEDGMLYSGWMAAYGTYGGAVAVTNPDSGETELIENPLGQQAVSGVAVSRTHLFVGTTLGANGLPDKSGEWARFGVLDIATRRVVCRRELEGVSSVRVLATLRGGDAVLLAAGGKLCVAEGPDWQIDRSRLASAPNLGSNCIGVVDLPVNRRAGGRRVVFYGSGKDLVALDVDKCAVWTLATLPDRITNVALWHRPEAGRRSRQGWKPIEVYASCGASLYRVRLTREWEEALGEGMVL